MDAAWCYLPADGQVENPEEVENLEVEEILEAKLIEPQVPVQRFWPMRKPAAKPVNNAAAPTAAPTKQSVLGHPTKGPMSAFLPMGVQQPKALNSALTESINDACKTKRLVDFMREMGVTSPEKYAKIPCIPDGKGRVEKRIPPRFVRYIAKKILFLAKFRF